MDFPDVLAILRYWQRHPPPHEVLYAMAGLKPKAAPQQAPAPANMSALKDFVHG